MTIYYLYVKTHKKTGLKYLGQTVQDPFKYRGSGKHWIRHLKKHGSDHHTELIQRCFSRLSLKEWGMYYSKLWSIVESNKWANIKPEEGTGGGTYFITNNPMKNPEIAKLFSGSNSPVKRPEVRKKISDSHIKKGDDHHAKNPISINKRSGINHYFKKNKHTSKDNPFYDHNIYNFQHIKTNEIIHMTQNDFVKTYQASAGNVSQLVRRKESPKSVKGWKLI